MEKNNLSKEVSGSLTSNKKNDFVRQINAVEDQLGQQTRFYNNALIVLLKLIRVKENKRLYEYIDILKKEIKKAEKFEEIVVFFEKFKDFTIKAELNLSENRADKKFLIKNIFKDLKSKKKIKKDSSVEVLNQKKIYMKALDGIKLYLGAGFYSKLNIISQRVDVAGSLNELDSISSDILHLIIDYITKLNEEIENMALFITDVGRNLFEVENNIKDSFEYSFQDFEGNKKFTDLLLDNMDDFSGQVNLSFSLEELKEIINKKINEIKVVIEKKNKDDKLHDKAVEQKIGLLYSSVGKLKSEVDSAKKKADSYRDQALKDPLTGAFNRRAYNKKAHEEMERFFRYENVFSMMLFDVDHFKRVNDLYGHAIGDKCLKEIIKRVKPGLRKTDFLARFGGEEFIVLLPETNRKKTAYVAEKIRGLVEEIEFFHKKERVLITISIGVTQAIKRDKSIDDVFKRLDKAMYKAKKNGRNRVAVL